MIAPLLIESQTELKEDVSGIFQMATRDSHVPDLPAGNADRSICTTVYLFSHTGGTWNIDQSTAVHPFLLPGVIKTQI
jgi:hypothetical protein